MLTAINFVSDVETFFNHLILVESLNFHPDEDFRNYVKLETVLPSYTNDEAEERNRLLDQCFEICERKATDIYQIGVETLFNQLTPKY
jgi:hypothetical protein